MFIWIFIAAVESKLTTLECVWKIVCRIKNQYSAQFIFFVSDNRHEADMQLQELMLTIASLYNRNY